MCYKKDICPLYKPHGPCDECLNCVYLQRARDSIRKARIGLVVAVIAFVIVTCMMW